MDKHTLMSVLKIGEHFVVWRVTPSKFNIHPSVEKSTVYSLQKCEILRLKIGTTREGVFETLFKVTKITLL